MDQNIRASGGGLNFSRILWAVKSRFSVILACFALGIVLAFFAASQVQPKYKASAQILFDPSAAAIPIAEPTLVPTILTLKALERAIGLI